MPNRKAKLYGRDINMSDDVSISESGYFRFEVNMELFVDNEMQLLF